VDDPSGTRSRVTINDVRTIEQEDEMPSAKGKGTEGNRASDYVRDVADAAKAGVDQASEYLGGMTDQTADYVKDGVKLAQDKVAELGSRRFDELWSAALRYTKRQPATALLIAVATGLALGLMVSRRSR
jgi:ElaB/YqjD/DUF883 family membrane-anchored ribosome-binding protein